MLASRCAVLPILLVTRASDWGAVLLIGLAGAAHQAWSANLFTSASDMFPKRAVASVVGLGGMAGSLGGILFPVYTGRLLDRFQAAGNITAGYAILFGICGSAYLVAFAITHLLAPQFEPIKCCKRAWPPLRPPCSTRRAERRVMAGAANGADGESGMTTSLP